MSKLTAILTALLAILCSLSIQAQRQMNYYPEGNSIVCVNGTNRYTRALYGTHTAFRLETSDRPVFATYRKGDCKNIQLYLIIDGHDYALDSIGDCKAYYEGGIRRYRLSQTLPMSEGIINITAIASFSEEGAMWRFETTGLPKKAMLKAVLSNTRSSKFKRNGDLGVDDLTKFESDGKPLQTVTWKAKGTTYLTLHDNKKLIANTYHSTSNTQFNNEIATIKAVMSRVVIDTPDPYFNPLGNVLMAAADGLWDGLDDEQGTGTWQHGCIGWRTPLAGWRGCYVGDAVGWFDRSRHHFEAYAKSQVTDVPATIPHPSQDSLLGMARAEKRWGTQMYSNGYICRYPNGKKTMHHYDMNLNYIDGLLWHLSYDADTTQLREFWPVLKLHLDWEKRNYDPDGDHLYDAYCCIWASDALYYNSGAVTHSSAYNYKGNKYAARIAEILGEPKDVVDYYRNEADAILKAMNERLWMPKEGHWAEFQDFMGKKRLHPSAAIWSIYTPIDCGACTPEQAWQATGYVTREIPHIEVMVDGCWQIADSTNSQHLTPNTQHLFTISTTDWLPYDWSTNNVAHEETANMALAYLQAGRGDEGFQLLKSDIIDEMYMGKSPGNFGQISYYDAVLKEAYRDFGDNIGVTSRALINGLFGIHPDALNGKCYIQPAFPDSWDHASIKTPYLSYEYKRINGRDSFKVEQHFPQQLEIVILPKYRGNGVEMNIPSHRELCTTPEYIHRMGLDSITPNAENRHVYLDLSRYYNAHVDDIFKNKYLSPRSPYTTLEIPTQGIGQWCHPEKTAQVDPLRLPQGGEIFNTKLGVKFKVSNTGNDIIYTSLWDNYPDSIDIDVSKQIAPSLQRGQRESLGRGQSLYLLLAGSTNNMQSRIDNALVIAIYDDNTTDTLHLENPINWTPINEAYNYNDEAFWTAPVRPLRFRLRDGYVGRDMLNKGTYETGAGSDVVVSSERDIPGGAGVILKMPLNARKQLKTIRLVTLSNDVVVGLMGATLERN